MNVYRKRKYDDQIDQLNERKRIEKTENLLLKSSHERISKQTKQKVAKEQVKQQSNVPFILRKTELDEKMKEKRLKQIEKGKNTVGYRNLQFKLENNLLNEKQLSEIPKTPPLNKYLSNRQFDGLYKICC